jgi:hypothetical protein
MRLCAIVALTFTTSLAMADLKSPGFEPYKGARQLCSEHVSGGKGSMHITWTSWATKDDLATVVAHYEKAHGKKAGTGDKGERTFSDDKNLRLSIYPATKNDDFPKCGKKPEAGEKTVVLISQAIR